MPRTNLEVTEGDVSCSLHFNPNATVCDALALMNHAPTNVGDEGEGDFEANVKLETALLPVKNQMGAIENYGLHRRFCH